MKKIMFLSLCFILAIGSNSCQMSRLKTDASFDVKKSVFHVGSQSYTFCNIPAGYLSKDIWIEKGYKYSLLIYYQDSSLLYFCESCLESPNYQNIENLNTPASRWRTHAELLLPLQQFDFESDFLNSYPDSCLYSMGEILFFGPKFLIDLNGNNGKGQFWRDIKVGDFCIGYITRNANRINDFDFFLTDNIKSLEYNASQNLAN